MATVASLLLQIGEAARKFKLLQNSSKAASTNQEKGDNDGEGRKGGEEKGEEPEWEISFEQLVANVLTQPALVSFFESQSDIVEVINKHQSQKFSRQTSSTSSTPSANENFLNLTLI